MLPLNLFIPRFRGHPVPNAPPLHPERVCQVGWMVGDGQTGPFRLDIRSVVALAPASQCSMRSISDG